MPNLTSEVYQHYEERDGRYYCLADGCNRSYKKTGSTSNMLFHYREKHKEDDADQPFRKRPRLKAPEVDETEAYESAVLTFFVAYGVPFQAVDSPEFLHLITTAGGHQKTISRKKLRDEILVREAAQCEHELKSVLQKQKISLCFDGFTEGSYHFLSVTATLINSAFEHQTVRIAVISLDSERAMAENLRTVIYSHLRRYAIKREDLVALTCDGGANAIKLGRIMGLPSVDCFCRVLNLCVKEGITVRPVFRIVTQIKMAAMTLKNNPMIYKRLKNFVGGKVLKMPNSTRWNSTYEMMQTFCNAEQKLREFIRLPEVSKSIVGVAIRAALSMDMAEINTLCKTLKFLNDICLLAEGRRSCASMIFYLIRRVEDYCGKRAQAPSTTLLYRELNKVILYAIKKYKVEYLKNDFLLICTFLDPRFVNHPNILERIDWTRSRQLTADMCEKTAVSSDSLPSTSDFDSSMATDNEEDGWNSWNRRSCDSDGSATSTIDNEIETYSSDALAEQLPMPDPKTNEMSIESVLSFWKRRKNRLPRLYSLAQRYLSVCCSSAEPERAFSSLTHLLCNPQCSNLPQENAERLMVIRQRLACRQLDQPLPDAYSDDEDILDMNIKEEE
ncbi:hypothetical protein QR680_014329 [Steinernema hermaphroditum]|uniref:HAT C-terminal dimerisation domain-containing protein n=1 Tax=Steinernema hermaphroditum TaxID=289476 RepID=A0AA39IAU9_9BILA|nr:hypothetical protein QR680_014329 [Steinernema hermaphroditum]